MFSKNVVELNDRIKQHNGTLSLELTVFSFYDEDSNSYIAVAPSIDVSSYGDTNEDAVAALNEAIDICIQFWINNNSLHSELEKLGWILSTSRAKIDAEKEALLDRLDSSWRSLRTIKESRHFAFG